MSTTKELTAADYAYVDKRKLAALWYAWGIIDGGGGGAVGSDDALAFADFHGEDARAYRAEEVSSLRSILEAWAAFTEYQVECLDASPVQVNLFDSRTEATIWADQGHVCTTNHRVTLVRRGEV